MSQMQPRSTNRGRQVGRHRALNPTRAGSTPAPGAHHVPSRDLNPPPKTFQQLTYADLVQLTRDMRDTDHPKAHWAIGPRAMAGILEAVSQIVLQTCAVMLRCDYANRREIKRLQAQAVDFSTTAHMLVTT